MNQVRVGLLIESDVVPAWVERMLRLWSAEDRISLDVVVKLNGSEQTASAKRPSYFYTLWRKLDRRVYGRPDDLLHSVNLTPLLSGTPVIDADLVLEADMASISDETLHSIRGYDLDVLLSIGSVQLAGRIFTAARCGVWTYELGGGFSIGDVHPGGLEILRGEETTACRLKMQRASDGSVAVLSESRSATDPVSISRSLNNLYLTIICFVRRRLEELREIGVSQFLEKYSAPDVIPDDHWHQCVSIPGNCAVAAGLGRLLGRKILAKITNHIYWEQWILLYRVSACEVERFGHWNSYKELIPPSDRFWADPCVVQHHGQAAIFIEELEYKNNIGYLSVITFDSNNNPILPPRKILSRPYHLSYPFIFEEQDTLYMIPESYSNGTIQLFRCTRFPDKWDFVMNLKENVAAVDTTIVRHHGRYWMFTTIMENDGASSSDELFLFYSDKLLTDHWHPHPSNPIVSDVRCARCAGRIYEEDGVLYRPAQDCASAYGKAITVQRIDELSETSYSESPYFRIDADWDPSITRTHTLSRAGYLSCIDGIKLRTFSHARPFAMLSSILNSAIGIRKRKEETSKPKIGEAEFESR